MIAKNIKKQIKEYFLLNPTKRLRVRQIERELNVPFPSVVRYTKELEKEKILRKQIIGDVHFYLADRASEIFLLEKKLFNIYSLFISGLINFLVKEFNNPNLIVFGSYSKGEDIESSDIDIYLETLNKEIKDIKIFEKKLQRKIQIFKHKTIKEIKNKELANNIINGIVLNGFIEVF